MSTAEPTRPPGEVDHRAEALSCFELQQQEYDRQMQQEYDRQIASAKGRGYNESRDYLARQTPPRGATLDDLRTEVVLSRIVIHTKALSGWDERAPEQALFSQEDWTDAYERGGRKAVQERYFEQKRELGFGRKEAHVPERTKRQEPDSQAVAKALIEKHLAARRAEFVEESSEVVAFSTVEAVAALNYWRGRAEEYNASREAIVRSHPELAKDLPPALEVDEIRVRQVTLEQEREQDRGLAIAR